MAPSEAAAGGGALTELRVARGNLYLSHALCTRHLPQTAAVALLAREGDVLIVPLHPGSAGGLLLKQRNAAGDRVIHAQEFFRNHGFDEECGPRTLPVRWCTQRAALLVSGLPRSGSGNQTISA
jgi:hypothetical protein